MLQGRHLLPLTLWKNIRTSGITCNIGGEVFYKRDDNRAWKGPATVLGQDGPVVFIREGSHYIKVHTCCVQPLNPDHFIETETINPDQYTKRKVENGNNNNNSNLNRVRSTTENENISDDEILSSPQTVATF